MNSEGLHGYDFVEYFKKIPIVNHYYKSVYSIDEIPNTLKVRQFIICNLSKKSEPGTHWIAIVRSDKKIYEVFNSLGYENLDTLLPYMRLKIKADVVFNEEAFQLSDSTTCGLFCIYFIVHRVLNYDMHFDHLLQDIFVLDKEINEKKVITFCDRLKKALDDSDLFEYLE